MIRGFAPYLVARMHACALKYEGYYEVVARISARIPMCAHILLGCAPTRASEMRAQE